MVLAEKGILPTLWDSGNCSPRLTSFLFHRGNVSSVCWVILCEKFYGDTIWKFGFAFWVPLLDFTWWFSFSVIHVHNSLLMLAHCPQSCIPWTNGPSACVCVLPCADKNLLWELWTLPLPYSGVGRALKGCLIPPCLSPTTALSIPTILTVYTNSFIVDWKRNLGICEFIILLVIQEGRNGTKKQIQVCFFFFFVCTYTSQRWKQCTYCHCGDIPSHLWRIST